MYKNEVNCYNKSIKNVVGDEVKMKLKLKVFFTNVSRIIRSFLFINMAWLLNTKAKAVEVMCYDVVRVEPIDDMTCYLTGPMEVEKSFIEKVLDSIVEDPEKVFFLLVPFILLTILFAVIMHKISERKKLEKKADESDNKQDENK